MTVAPVVVKPEKDSNTASEIPKLGIPPKYKGKAPIKLSTVQNKITIKNLIYAMQLIIKVNVSSN